MTSLDLLAAADCEQVLVLRDRDAEALAVIAVHDTRLGPAHGGIRRWPYAGLREAVADLLLLAEAMTWKCALAEVAAGGGKAVILDHPKLDRAAAYRLVGEAVERMGGQFFTGPDVGTNADDLAVVAAATRFVATGDAGGPGDLAQATATGVAAAMAALARRLGLPLPGLRVTVQGLGAVGMHLCAQLHEAGAELVVADVVPARVTEAVARFAARAVPVAEVLDQPGDVFAPCALGAVIDEAVAERLPARGVCGSANNIFATPQAMAVLHRRGVMAVPDFVANAGALIAGATWHLTGHWVDDQRIRRIGTTVDQLFDRAEAVGEPPHAVAMRTARERVEAAAGRRNEERR